MQQFYKLNKVVLMLIITSLFTLYLTTTFNVQKSQAANPSSEAQFVALTNQLRASKGLPPLQVNAMLVNKARNWAQVQANAGNIFHSTLSNGISGNWYRLGENVGRGGSVQSIFNALVASPGHYANLVDPGFTYIGLGVVDVEGGLYMAQEFMQMKTAAPAPAPKAPTAPRATTPAPAVRPPTTTPAVTPPTTQPAANNAPQKIATSSKPVIKKAARKTASPELQSIMTRLYNLDIDQSRR